MKSHCATVKMKMKAIDQYNPERVVVYQDRKNSNRTLDTFQFFIAFLGVKHSSTVQSRNVVIRW